MLSSHKLHCNCSLKVKISRKPTLTVSSNYLWWDVPAFAQNQMEFTPKHCDPLVQSTLHGLSSVNECKICVNAHQVSPNHNGGHLQKWPPVFAESALLNIDLQWTDKEYFLCKVVNPNHKDWVSRLLLSWTIFLAKL